MELYQERLLTESIRVIEKDIPLNNFTADYNNLSIEKALSTRTQLAELRYQASPVISHFLQLFKLFCSLMCLLFLVLGATSVSQLLLSDLGSKINFFWAIILFIAPNILSLIIWLFLYFTQRTFNLSWVSTISLLLIGLLDKLQHKLSSKHPYYLPLFQFYFKHRFSGYMGKVQLSFISHLFWSCYLVGATLSLLLVLATHQVDFIWQTTILSEDAFLWFTQWLTYLPNMFMLNVPSPLEVSLASIDISNSLQTAQNARISWSNLLIFSLTIYALLPRLILTFVFYQRVRMVQKQFKLDLSLPYYVQLKNILYPINSESFIKDPDLDGPTVIDRVRNHQAYNHSLVIPNNAFPFAIELKAKYLEKVGVHASSFHHGNIINVLDGETQAAALSAFQASQSDSIILYVDVMRVPDRGWLSLVKKCKAKNNASIYLILLGDVEPNDITLDRIQGWIDIAAQAHIPELNISYLFNDQQAQTTRLNEEVIDG